MLFANLVRGVRFLSHGESRTPAIRPEEFQSLGPSLDLSGQNLPVEILFDRANHIGYTRPDIKDLSSLYANRASKDFQPAETSFMKFVKGAALRKEATELLSKFDNTPASILDYGCGDGRLTEALAAASQNTSVTGADFARDPPEGFVVAGYTSYEALAASKATFDAIICRHVLEHTDEPQSELAKLKTLLAPGGSLFIEVPNVYCPWSWILGKYWDAWYTPFHRIHFSRQSLNATLTTAGFRAYASEDREMPHMGRSIRNFTGGRYGNGLFVIGILLHPVQMAVSALYRQPSALRCWARAAQTFAQR